MKPDVIDEGTRTALSNLSAGLWRIQELLDLLSYKLEVQQVLIESGRATWLGRATRDIESVLDQMRGSELMRAIDAGPVCEALGLPLDTPLSQIAAHAPAPWNQVLDEHRSTLSTATGELSRLSKSNSELLDVSYRAVQDALDRFNHKAEESTYTATGALATRRTHHLFDLTT